MTESLHAILAEVAARHGIGVKDLRGPGRHQPLAQIRQEAMWEASRRTALSPRAIGRLMGGRDRKTITHGAHRHAQRITQVTP